MAAKALEVCQLFSVKGKTAVITGGGSGLGEMMATSFVINGGNVIIASRKEKALSAACDKMNALGKGKASYIVGDISTKAGCDAIANEVKKRVNKIHVLVNNSGVTWGAEYDKVPEKEGWERVMNANVKGVFYLTVALTDLLAKDANNIDPGRVIVISSVAGVISSATETGLAGPGIGLWSYNASKAAAISLSNTLATTLSRKFITVNAICPGIFPSRMSSFGMSTNEQSLIDAHPMGRLGTPEDIAGLFLLLCSRAGSHLSANFILSDGGATAAGAGLGHGEAEPKL